MHDHSLVITYKHVNHNFYVTKTKQKSTQNIIHMNLQFIYKALIVCSACNTIFRSMTVALFKWSIYVYDMYDWLCPVYIQHVLSSVILMDKCYLFVAGEWSRRSQSNRSVLSRWYIIHVLSRSFFNKLLTLKKILTFYIIVYYYTQWHILM